MGLISKGGGLCAGAIAVAGSVALWNALLSLLAKRRLRQGVRMVRVKTREGRTTSVAVYEAGEECDTGCTVFLDSGLGMSAISWSWVMQEVAKSCRVVAFDRPGLGASPSLPSGSGWLRRVDDIVDLNRAVLAEMGVKGRLILVGHSTSGMHVRLHAHLHKEEVMAAVLVDAAHEGQLNAAEGNSVYNSYPPAHVTDAKLSRVKRLWHSGLLRLMYVASGPTFWRACSMFPPLFLALRWLDWMGRAAAQGVMQNQKMLGPHFPPEKRARFMDEQFSLEGMCGMIAEHGSQRESMSYMLEQGIMRPLSLGRLPLLVISRDPQKGAGGGLYPNARGDPAREAQHEAFQVEQKELSREGKRIVVQGAGHGSLLFVRDHAHKTAQAISDLVREVGHGPMPVWWTRYHTV